MNKFGGEIRFALSTGEKPVLRGQIEVMPSNINAGSVTNQNGSVSKTAELTGYRFNITPEDGGEDWDAIMRADSFNMTAVEDYTGVTHMWTDGTFVGEPSINRNTGEVSGISGIANRYTRTAG